MATAYTKFYDHIVRQIMVECTIQLPYSASVDYDNLLALWDTGANITCISARLAEKLRLEPSDVVTIAVANNELFHADVYYVQLSMGQFTIPFTKVLGIPMDESKELIIGMDVISKGDLAISNFDGKTVLSFRAPSLERIDFTKYDAS